MCDEVITLKHLEHHNKTTPVGKNEKQSVFHMQHLGWDVNQQPEWAAHLGAVQADDAVDVARAVVEVGNRDGMLAGGQPVLLGVGINLEDVGPRAVDGLLPEGNEEEVVNLFVPQHQRLTKTAAGNETPVAHRGVRSPG